MTILQAVSAQHASVNTKLHALYGYYFLNLLVAELARVYCKAPDTIKNSIEAYETFQSVDRRFPTSQQRKFTSEQRQWLLQYYLQNSLSYLDEVKRAFEKQGAEAISILSVWRIIHEHGLHWKVRLLLLCMATH
ncbi:hypothetical protein RI367_007904 [Sorochytrium milnesiophthora]